MAFSQPIIPLLLLSSALAAVCTASPADLVPPSVALPPSLQVVAGDVLSILERSPHLSPSAGVEVLKLEHLQPSEGDNPLKALGGFVEGLNQKEKDVAAPVLSPENRDHVKKTIGSFSQIAAMITSHDDKGVALPPVNMDALIGATSARQTDEEEGVASVSTGVGGSLLATASGLVVFSVFFF
ncbi:hypothetical protein H6P81_011645 [Aristolochia fimbriata]|uniref:Uncharacterized protein n=1 Tax=Aristolochia fimbriata TaxID=158543 RepID=A0AAV7ECR2_ARIFI|nr:hypothetical protein H6P81_011645 [Aristolochia fimbriata]